ncbi:hypothetical protein HPP92_000377 [Vanilla planifolia]|uniref:Uncharacterized protein n=1 Tax=Vanilla planifolia TaxID=51239 RepID=A0A835VKE2_VANPL|nr:hypothetical protein HPP92_000377 [Vanilla planifolia]
MKETAVNNIVQEASFGNGRRMSSRQIPKELLAEAQLTRRHSKRLASQAREKSFESTGFRDVKWPRRVLGLASVSAENELMKPGTNNEMENGRPQELLCAAAKSQILRRSTRLASISSGIGKEFNDKARGRPRHISQKGKSCRPATSAVVMKKGVNRYSFSKEKKVAEGHRLYRMNSLEDKKTEQGCVATKNRQSHMEKSRKVEKKCASMAMTGTMETGKCLGSLEWTTEQEAALQEAYLVARPSPHFWKKVPGKSAQECFEKIHSSILTPLSSQPGSRPRRKNLSPIGSFSLSGGISPYMTELNAETFRRGKIKKLAAQRTVRCLLRKHRLADQNIEADHFTLLESSPTNITFDLFGIELPKTSTSTPCHADQPGERSTINSKMYSRFKLLSSPGSSSPEVLKQIKNRALHDKYIDQLHYREARRVMLSKKTNKDSKGNEYNGKLDSCVLKAAKTALICDAKSFISHFQRTQANLIEDDIDEYSDTDRDEHASDLDE